MSRNFHELDEGYVIWGNDPSFRTWYAQLYQQGDSHHDAPRKAVGYHPVEVSLARDTRPDIDIGPYPVDSAAQLRQIVKDRWGIDLPIREGA